VIRSKLAASRAHPGDRTPVRLVASRRVDVAAALGERGNGLGRCGQLGRDGQVGSHRMQLVEIGCQHRL
jgi:hypothetical protein